MAMCSKSHNYIRWAPCIIITCLIISNVIPLYAAPIRTVEAVATKISDGDTIQAVTKEGTKIKIRLYGIDAPETEKSNKKTGHVSKQGEPFGEESREYLSSMIDGKHIRIDIITIDRYRRMVGVIWLDNKNVNLEMIKASMAEAYREYLKEPYRAQFIQAERVARADKRGIWSQGANYERPSAYRKRMGIGEI